MAHPRSLPVNIYSNHIHCSPALHTSVNFVLYAIGLFNKGRKPWLASLMSMHGLGVLLHHSTMHCDL